MLSIILISFLSLITLLILHELSHFLTAKKFGVEVREFGVGYPPRLIAKKVKDTLYSINLLPFGAFVDIPYEALRRKSFWQRFLVLAAGVISFWIFSVILIGLVILIGAPTQVSDEEVFDDNGVWVQITDIIPESPAEEAGIKIGDIIKEFFTPDYNLTISKVEQVQDFVKNHKGKEVTLTIQRGKDILHIPLVLRSDDSGQGFLGVVLVRVAIIKTPWYRAIVKAIKETIGLTYLIVKGLAGAIVSIFTGKDSGIELVGPVGIMEIFVRSGALGINYFLQTIALISLHLAIFNAFPLIPVSDGGRILFLVIENIRKKPLDKKTEEKINGFFFALLLLLMLLVTIKDVGRLF